MVIHQLTLFTQKLQEQRDFYHGLLGLKILRESEDSVDFQAGYTTLQLQETHTPTRYHFAFNIPGNNEVEALEWLRTRAPILTDHGREIQDFSSWEARSVYFSDPDGNIVEFIARRRLSALRQRPFNPGAILGISEIGLAVDQVKQTCHALTEKLGLALFDGDLVHFSAIGDDHGLFICVDRASKTWYPTGHPAKPADFEIRVSANKSEFNISYLNEHLDIQQLD